MPGMSQGAKKTLWSRTKRITQGLLLAWLGVNLVVPWFARDLDALRLFGLPLGWWLASQGVLLLYLALIVVYAVVMDRMEARYLDEAEDAPRTVP
jgi:putative solute:sodium symporter small subunit